MIWRKGWPRKGESGAWAGGIVVGGYVRHFGRRGEERGSKNRIAQQYARSVSAPSPGFLIPVSSRQIGHMVVTTASPRVAHDLHMWA